jgi:hypothetical protein
LCNTCFITNPTDKNGLHSGRPAAEQMGEE